MRALFSSLVLVEGFLFHHFKYIIPLFLASTVSAEKSGLWEFLCMLLVAFPLLLLIFSIFNFFLLVMMSLATVLFGLILNWIFCTSWTWISISFPTLRKFSSIMSSTMFSVSFSLYSPLSIYNLYSMYSVGLYFLLMLFQRSLKQSSFLSFLFLFFCSASVISTAVFQLIHLSLCFI